ncbi:hypothetical protein CKO31_24130 [Thiohalocapsa halophila]|uniref:Uncharacterized protein n=1 Tax=Thiohalocapsa halophila TaxID=69359 RepID=A0ABS1CPI8_9GAMM|nr:hypothetical protein [Thiohalocapsa halophila]MBK1633770.1 hypothetical protein [Thiohalocapsa halophila]
MQIDTATLAKAITRACAELDRLDEAAAEGEIGRIAGRRLVLRIEPAGADWSGREIPLPPGAEGIVSALELPPEAEPGPSDAPGIRSPLNACCHRDACRELLTALELICENPDHDLLPTERATAEAAIAKATGEG